MAQKKKKSKRSKARRSRTRMGEEDSEIFLPTMMFLERSAREESMHILQLKGLIRGSIHYWFIKGRWKEAAKGGFFIMR